MYKNEDERENGRALVSSSVCTRIPEAVTLRPYCKTRIYDTPHTNRVSGLVWAAGCWLYTLHVSFVIHKKVALSFRSHCWTVRLTGMDHFYVRCVCLNGRSKGTALIQKSQGWLLCWGHGGAAILF